MKRVESKKQIMSIDQLTVEIQNEARDWFEQQTGAKINWDAIENQLNSQNSGKGGRKRKKK